jgi:hypothetical protein
MERKKQPDVQQLGGASSSTSQLDYGRIQGLGSCKVRTVVGLHSVVIPVLVWLRLDGLIIFSHDAFTLNKICAQACSLKKCVEFMPLLYLFYLIFLDQQIYKSGNLNMRH